MTNQSTANAIIDYKAQMDAEVANIAKTIAAPSGNVISTKGKLFTLPDGTTNAGPIRAVILDYVSYNSYFPGIYNPNAIVPPACFAIGKEIATLAPSPNSPNKQHDTCNGCARDAWGSAPTGGKGKACKNTRRIAIVPVNATLNTTPMTISISPTALKAFDGYVTRIAREFGAPLIRVVTSISFNPNEAYPTLQFDEPQLHENMEVMMALRPRAQEMLAREPDVSKAK